MIDFPENKLEKAIESDISGIRNAFGRFKTSFDLDPLMEHRFRTWAFFGCCFSTGNVNVGLVEEYADAYNDLTKQDDMIKKCYKPGKDSAGESCERERNLLKERRKDNNK